MDTKIKHFYETIDGFMSNKNKILFDYILENWKGGNWVEVGSWTGKSTAYIVVELLNKNKNFNFFAIDTWKGSDEHQDLDIIKNNQLYDTFNNNISIIKKHVKSIKSISWDAAKSFEDKSVDVCYIDADHQYESVVKDLDAFWPKVKENGIFCGDDYTKGFPGVQKAISEFSKTKNIPVKRIGRCWYIIKSNL